jgi:GNAT superfamily N-acetyltransferase
MEAPEDHTTHFWALASDRVELGSSMWARRASAPSLGLANFMYAVRPENVRALDADLVRATAAGHCLRIVIESGTPKWVEAELALRGWAVENEFRFELAPDATLADSPPVAHVRPAREVDPDWTVRSQMFRRDHLEEDERRGAPPRPLAHTAATIEHRRDLESQATYHCTQRDGEFAGFVCTWSGPAASGMIEDVFVHPDHRGHGVATALLHSAVGTLRSQGAHRITIAAEVGDTPALLYARLGFRPRSLVRSCVLPEESDPDSAS